MYLDEEFSEEDPLDKKNLDENNLDKKLPYNIFFEALLKNHSIVGINICLLTQIIIVFQLI